MQGHSFFIYNPSATPLTQRQWCHSCIPPASWDYSVCFSLLDDELVHCVWQVVGPEERWYHGTLASWERKQKGYR